LPIFSGISQNYCGGRGSEIIFVTITDEVSLGTEDERIQQKAMGGPVRESDQEILIRRNCFQCTRWIFPSVHDLVPTPQRQKESADEVDHSRELSKEVGERTRKGIAIEKIY
jgi:hypothetical protein